MSLRSNLNASPFWLAECASGIPCAPNFDNKDVQPSSREEKNGLSSYQASRRAGGRSTIIQKPQPNLKHIDDGPRTTATRLRQNSDTVAGTVKLQQRRLTASVTVKRERFGNFLLRETRIPLSMFSVFENADLVFRYLPHGPRWRQPERGCEVKGNRSCSENRQDSS